MVIEIRKCAYNRKKYQSDYHEYESWNDELKENERHQIAVFEGDIVRLALQDRNETPNYQLLDEIIYMEIYYNDIMWQIIRDGIKIVDEDYILYSAATGQVKNTTVTLMKNRSLKSIRDIY